MNEIELNGKKKEQIGVRGEGGDLKELYIDSKKKGLGLGF